MNSSDPSTIPECVASAPRPPRQRRKESRPAELTAAALEQFVEKGYAATRLEDVAAQAGVSKGTLYLYFDGKEALFKAVVEEGIVPVLAAAEQQLAGYSGSASELLRRLLFGWWEQIGATRLSGLPKLIVAESHNFPEVAQYYHDKVIARARGLLRNVLLRGIESGEFRALDVETAIDVIIAPLLMLVIWRSSLRFCGRESSPEAFLQTHFELLIQGLRPAAGPCLDKV